MTYKLPEPMISIIGLKLDIYTRLYVQEIADAAYAAGQRDMLERAIALFNQPYVAHDGAEIVDKLKELLNEH